MAYLYGAYVGIGKLGFYYRVVEDLMKRLKPHRVSIASWTRYIDAWEPWKTRPTLSRHLPLSPSCLFCFPFFFFPGSKIVSCFPMNF
jgi:hypothetical protein